MRTPRVGFTGLLGFAYFYPVENGLAETLIPRESVQVRDQLLDECNIVGCVLQDDPFRASFNLANVEQGPERGNDLDDSYWCLDIG